MDLTVLYILLFLIPIGFCCFAVISDILDARRKRKDAKLDEEMGRFANWWDPDFMKRFKEARVARRERYGTNTNSQPRAPSPKLYLTSHVDAQARLRTLWEDPKPADAAAAAASSSYPPVRPPGWTYGNLGNLPPPDVDIADAKSREAMPQKDAFTPYPGVNHDIVDQPDNVVAREREHYPQEVEDAFEVYRARLLNGEAVTPPQIPTLEELQREIDAQARTGLGPGIVEYYGGDSVRREEGRGKEKEKEKGRREEDRDDKHHQRSQSVGGDHGKDQRHRGRHRDRDGDKKHHRSHSECRSSRNDGRDDKHRSRRSHDDGGRSRHRSRDPGRERRHQEREIRRREKERVDKEIKDYHEENPVYQDSKGKLRFVKTDELVNAPSSHTGRWWKF